MSILRDIKNAVNFYVNRWQVTDDGKKFIEEVGTLSHEHNNDDNHDEHHDEQHTENTSNETTLDESDQSIRDGFNNTNNSRPTSTKFIPDAAIMPLFSPHFVLVMAILTLIVGATIFGLNMQTIKPPQLLAVLCFSSGILHIILALFAYLRNASWFPNFLNIFRYNWIRQGFTILFFIGYIPILGAILIATLKALIHLIRIDDFVEMTSSYPPNENHIANVGKLWAYLIMSFPSLAGLATGLVFLQKAY